MTERTIFLTALEITDHGSRIAYLDEACAGDNKLRSQVEALLSSHERSSQFLETPATAGELVSEKTLVSDNPADADDDHEYSADQTAEAKLRTYLQPSTRTGWLGRLAHYEVETILGAGAFGIVAKAFDEKLQRVVAIKLMNPELAATSPPRKRFLREARTAAAVRHENIVGIYAVEEEPLPYLVMEYIPGITLQQRLDQNGPLEVGEILRIGRQVAAGLTAAHAANLIHRDIKPSNILLEGGIENRAKISDFGLARAVDDASLTQSGLIAGTPMYMAPEQARGEVLDHRVDLFSMGSVLYQMASGRPPFRASSTIAVLKRVCDDTPRPIQDVIPATPDWLCAIITRLLEKTPDNRFQTAKEVAELFARCQAELQLSGKVTCVPDASRASVTTSSSTAGAVPSSQAIRSKHRAGAADSGTTGEARAKKVIHAIAKSPLYWIVLGMFAVFFPIVCAPSIARWLDPAIPPLPVTQLTTGLDFDGKDDCVKVDSLNWSYPQFTIEAFVTSVGSSDNGTILNLGSVGKNVEWMSLYDGTPGTEGGRKSGAQIRGQTPYATAYGPLTPGVREHRVLVFDGSHLHYYINGIWQGKRYGAAHEGMMWKMQELRLGCGGDDRRFFQGRIDQVHISKVARYTNNFPPITSVTSDKSTLALYNFDEGQGDVLHDSSGNDHHGQILGATWVSPRPLTEISNTKSQTSDFSSGWYGWPPGAAAPAIAPFNASEAKEHQHAWAKHLNIPAKFKDPSGSELVLIPPGEFLMGSPEADIDRLSRELKQAGASEYDQFASRSSGPQHQVRVTRPFYISTCEITVGEYRQFIDETHYIPTSEQLAVKSPSWIESAQGEDAEQRAVIGVSWEDANAYCHWRSKRDGVTCELPTEAQWEYACRGGTATLWSYGDDPAQLEVYAVVGQPSLWPAEVVGTKKPNPFGLFDMHGNAEEWCRDWHSSATYSQSLVKDPLMLENPQDPASGRVCRGGSSQSAAWRTRSATRLYDFPSTPKNPKGFRIVITGDLQQATTTLASE